MSDYTRFLIALVLRAVASKHGKDWYWNCPPFDCQRMVEDATDRTKHRAWHDATVCLGRCPHGIRSGWLK